MGGVQMNRALVLETVVRSPDGAGGFAESWVALGALWAGVEPVGSVTPRAKVFVRAMPNTSLARPVPGQRFREGGRLYVIRHVAALLSNARVLVCFTDVEEEGAA